MASKYRKRKEQERTQYIVIGICCLLAMVYFLFASRNVPQPNDSGGVPGKKPSVEPSDAMKLSMGKKENKLMNAQQGIQAGSDLLGVPFVRCAMSGTDKASAQIVRKMACSVPHVLVL